MSDTLNLQGSLLVKFVADRRQLIKWVVYALLIVDYFLYFRDDWYAAIYTMRNGGSLLDWTGAFASTIDNSAWLVLLALFELETYSLSDRILNGPLRWVIRGVRILCYVLLSHTLYAYGTYLYDLLQVTPIPNISDLCQLAGGDISYAKNLAFTTINQANCASLAHGSQFFYIDTNVVVTDSSGLVIEQHLAWVDFIDAITWLCIVFIIEGMVQLQEHGIVKGLLIKVLNATSLLLYLLLWCAIAYWIFKGHWFAWDETLWIAGFAIIEMNVDEWRNEILDEADNPTAAACSVS